MTEIEVGKEYKVTRPNAKGYYKILEIRTRENGEVTVVAQGRNRPHSNQFRPEEILIEEERNKKMSKGEQLRYTVLGQVGEFNGLPVEVVELHSAPGARGKRNK